VAESNRAATAAGAPGIMKSNRTLLGCPSRRTAGSRSLVLVIATLESTFL
jgi:hypothetical protein